MARWSVCVLSALLVVCMTVGCVAPSTRDDASNPITSSQKTGTLSSSEQHEELVRNLGRLHRELKKTRAELEAERRKLDKLREQRSRTQLSRNLRAESIEIPFFSPIAESEGLDLWVIPRDPEGDVVKVPGTLLVSIRRRGLLGLGTTGKTLCEWSVPADKLKERWEGQLYQGYHLLLPWSNGDPPDLAETMVRVRFIGPDGQTCKTEKPIESGE